MSLKYSFTCCVYVSWMILPHMYLLLFAGDGRGSNHLLHPCIHHWTSTSKRKLQCHLALNRQYQAANCLNMYVTWKDINTEWVTASWPMRVMDTDKSGNPEITYHKANLNFKWETEKWIDWSIQGCFINLKQPMHHRFRPPITPVEKREVIRLCTHPLCVCVCVCVRERDTHRSNFKAGVSLVAATVSNSILAFTCFKETEFISIEINARTTTPQSKAPAERRRARS